VNALDGNAIAGQLFDVFGLEMTTAKGICASCGAIGLLAELEVYLHGPGTVARCRTCGALLMVFVTIRGISCVDLGGLADLEAPR
jgi:hypothetical protein